MISRNKREFLSEGEIHKLLSYVKSQADSVRKRGASRAIVDEIIILLLIKAGLRPDEVCQLRIEDLPVIHGEKALWIRNSNSGITRKVDIFSKT